MKMGKFSHRKGVRIQHNKKIFATIILLLILLIFLLFLINTKKNQENQELGNCVVDSDCKKQQTTCCSCNMGGREECISKKNVSYWQNKIGDCREDILCTAVYNCKETECKCIEGVCKEE